MLGSIAYFLLTVLACIEALSLRPKLHNFLFDISENLLKETMKSICVQHETNLNLLLRLAFCGFFDFNQLFPSDLTILQSLIKSLRQKKCPQSVEERFYNLITLQSSEAGRNFLIEFNINLARVGWWPDIFTPKQVKDILAKIQTYSPSQIEYLDPMALSHVLANDDDNAGDNCKFFNVDGHWNLFGVETFQNLDLDDEMMLRWLKQVRSHVAKDDLLFYRLAFLSRSNQSSSSIGGQFLRASRKLLRRKSSKGFRNAVLDYYTKKTSSIRPILEISNSVLANNPVAQATLHFQHYIAAFEGDYPVSYSQIVELFKKFNPALVSPFLCRSLLGNFRYRDFILINQTFSSEWQKLYYNSHREYGYFPKSFLPANIQIKLWRHKKLLTADGFGFSIPALYLHEFQKWKQYFEVDCLINENIAMERDGVTLIDCRASRRDLIRKFIEGRIMKFLLYETPLPIFGPVLFGYRLVSKEDRHLIKDELLKTLCLPHTDNKEQLKSKDAQESLQILVDSFERWNVPPLFFGSTEGIFPLKTSDL